MKQFISLLKATTKGDIKIFKYNRRNQSGLALMLFLSLIFFFCFYNYASLISEPLEETPYMYLLLTLFAAFMVIMNILEGVYKSQGILFDAKDNNLLFSMPIKKHYILAVRLIKLLVYDYIFEALMFLPAILRYIVVVNPSISFYIITLIFFILLPLIPLIISCIIGYIIKAFSSLFKKKNFIQIITSILLIGVVYYFSFNLNTILEKIVTNASNINEIISKIYLPIGLYIDIINEFDIIKFIELLLISIIPFILFIYIFQIKYDSIINRNKEISTNKKINKKATIKSTNIITSLTKKEIKTYFSITSYVINTIIGPLLALAGAIGLWIKEDSILNILTSSDFNLRENTIIEYLPLLIIGFIAIVCAMTTITSSSISLEGKKITLLKSLPIKAKDIFLSKIITSDLILGIPLLISSILMIIKLQIFNYNIIFILLTCVLLPHITGQIGLFINLLYPKLNYENETEVIKQSMAVTITLLFNVVMIILLIALIVKLNLSYIMSILLLFIILFTITIILNKLLNTKGKELYNKLT